MRILITGSKGNIGSTLMPYLQSMGHMTFGVDIVQGISNNYRVVDINHPVELADVFRLFKPDICFHLASMVSRVTCEASPALTIQTNVSGTNNVLQLCKVYDVKLIYFSTSEIYGNIRGLLSEDRSDISPNNLYGISKLMGEQLVKYNITCGLNSIIVRPFMLYQEGEQTGDHHSALIRFCDGLIKRQKITVHKGTLRSWLYMNDAIQIFELLLNVDGNHIINIGNPDVYRIEELARMICNKLVLDYTDYVEEIEMPQRMSYTKVPNLQKQTAFTGFNNFTSLEKGIDKVINKML